MNTRNLAPIAKWLLVTMMAINIVRGTALYSEELELKTPFCQSVDGTSSPWLDLEIADFPRSETDSTYKFLNFLHRLGIPISSIAQKGYAMWGSETLEIPENALSLDDALKIIGEQYPDYICEIRAGRLILRSRDTLFDTIISGVDIKDVPRVTAVRAYIAHLRDFDPKFENWSEPIIATAGEGPYPVLEDPVTLTSSASLIQHLVQFIDQDEAYYFYVSSPSEQWPRMIDIHTVRQLKLITDE